MIRATSSRFVAWLRICFSLAVFCWSPSESSFSTPNTWLPTVCTNASALASWAAAGPAMPAATTKPAPATSTARRLSGQPCALFRILPLRVLEDVIVGILARRLGRIDHGLAPLGVGRADRGVEIEAVPPQVVDHPERLLALRDPVGCVAADLLGRLQAALVPGIRDPVAEPPEAVTDAGRPEQRQHQVGTRLHPVLAERLAEVGPVRLVAELGRDVEQAGDAERRVDHEAVEGVAGLVPVTLQDVVGEHDRRGEIGEEVPHRPPYLLRQHLLVGPRDRFQDVLVGGVVEAED